LGRCQTPKIALPARTGNDLSVTAELVSLKANLVTSIHNVFAIARVIKELVQNLNFLLHFRENQ